MSVHELELALEVEGWDWIELELLESDSVIELDWLEKELIRPSGFDPGTHPDSH